MNRDQNLPPTDRDTMPDRDAGQSTPESVPFWQDSDVTTEEDVQQDTYTPERRREHDRARSSEHTPLAPA